MKPYSRRFLWIKIMRFRSWVYYFDYSIDYFAVTSAKWKEERQEISFLLYLRQHTQLIASLTWRRTCTSKTVPFSFHKTLKDKENECFCNTFIFEQLFASYQHPTPRRTVLIDFISEDALFNIWESSDDILAAMVLEKTSRSTQSRRFVINVHD